MRDLRSHALARRPRARAPRPLPWLLLATPLLVIGFPGCPTGDDDDTTTADDDDAGDDDTVAGDPEIHVEEPDEAAPYDECEEICFSALLKLEGEPLPGVEAAVEVDGVGVIHEGLTDEDGRVRICVAGLPSGQRTAAFTFRWPPDKIRAEVEIELYPFGYAQGLVKPLAPLDELPWVPAATKHPGNPVLGAGAVEEWDAAGILLPSVVDHGGTYYLYYAGTQTGDYEIGLATSTDGLAWERHVANPIIPLSGQTGSWKRWATNSPAVVVDGDTFRMWYAGRAEEFSNIAIGYAESTDGVTFVDHGVNPVLVAAPGGEEGSSVSHPTVVARDGFYEMWYSTASHDVRYALSADGVSWTRYCHNPVLEGASGSWEMGQVKSSEVWFDGDLYWASYAGGSSGAFQIGWAASEDGLRWIKGLDPWIPRGDPGSWEGTSTLGAVMVPEGSDLHIWYSGTSAAGGQIGYAGAEVAP